MKNGLSWKEQCSVREEANAITCYAFRNGYLETLHAGKYSELLEADELSRITDEEMKKFMIEVSEKMAKVLAMKQTAPDAYWKLIEFFATSYTSHWIK